jgi:hypothetical protein
LKVVQRTANDEVAAMKRLVLLMICGLVLGSAVVVGWGARAPAPDEAARAAAIKLFDSLDDGQKKAAVKDFSDKERFVEAFPAVERPGLSFDKLSAEQKRLVEEVLRAMTSDYGASRCLAVAKQTPANRTYLNFFGTPVVEQPFAWRVAAHHLTLIYAEFGKDRASDFGPILLGGNPVNDLWDAEEKLALELYAALSPEELRSVKGKAGSGSGAAIGAAGMVIGDLAEKPRALAGKLLQQRLAVLSDDRRRVFEQMVQRDGGVEKLRLAFWGEADKSHRDNGNYQWKIGGTSVLCDWQTVGKNHIHMTLRARGKS